MGETLQQYLYLRFHLIARHFFKILWKGCEGMKVELFLDAGSESAYKA